MPPFLLPHRDPQLVSWRQQLDVGALPAVAAELVTDFRATLSPQQTRCYNELLHNSDISWDEKVRGTNAPTIAQLVHSLVSGVTPDVPSPALPEFRQALTTQQWETYLQQTREPAEPGQAPRDEDICLTQLSAD